MSAAWKEYILNGDTIEEISAEVQAYMEEIDEDKRNILRSRLLIEELLLRIRDHHETEIKLHVLIGRHYGRHIFKINYSGDAFDPTVSNVEDNTILETIGISPMWGYHKNTNVVSMTLSGRVKSGRIFKILLAIALAALCGYLGTFMPDSVRTGIDRTVLSPLISCFLGLLATFAGFMIAFTITSGVIGIGDSASLSNIGRKVMLRFFLMSILTSVVALLATYPLFTFTSGGGDSTSFQAEGILSVVFDILPRNPVDPFLSGNSLQIIVIGLFVGVGLLALGERTKVIRSFVQEGASLTQWLTSSVCSLVPIFVFISLLHQIWSGNISELLSVWRPLLIVIGVTVVWGIVLLLYTAFRSKCSPIIILKKIMPIFVIGITTASSMTAFTAGIQTCEKKLGIDNSYVRFAYPLGNVMYMQGTVIYLTVISLFFGETFDLEVSIIWFMVTVFSAALLAIAVPPIPGAGMMLFTILFSQLGIPDDALVMAIAMDIVIDFVDTGSNLFMMLLELTNGARSMKRLDHEILKSESVMTEPH